MTDHPTNRIGRPSDGWAHSDDAHTQRAYQPSHLATPPTSKIRESNEPTQVSPQAGSEDAGEPGYYRESGGYYPESQRSTRHPAPDAYSAPQSDLGEPSPKAWFRSAPTYLLAAAAVAVLTAGGGLAYTLTSSDHPAPAHPSVQPAPQQNNDVPPAPQAPPPAQDQPPAPAPAPDAPVSVPDDSSGSAPNVAPEPAVAPTPAVALPPAPQQEQQQPDLNPPLPANQQQQQQQPVPKQFPNNQQQPGHHHPPNNQQNQNQQNQQNQTQNQNQNQNQPQQQNQQQQQQPNNQQQKQNNQQQQQPQNQQQKPESANDTLCHPKPPPC